MAEQRSRARRHELDERMVPVEIQLRKLAAGGAAAQIESYARRLVRRRESGDADVREWLARGDWRIRALGWIQSSPIAGWAAKASDDALAARCLRAIAKLAQPSPKELRAAAVAAACEAGPAAMGAFDALGMEWDEGSLSQAAFFAARWGKPSTLEWLLDKGAPIESKDERDGGWSTLLMASCHQQDARACALLISRGADVMAARSDGLDAAMHAARLGRLDCLRALEAGGAELGRRDNAGRSALEYAPEGSEAFLWLRGRKAAKAEARELRAESLGGELSGAKPSARM